MIETKIFRAEYGSRAHGTSTVDSDHDYMEIIVEPEEFITGLSTCGVRRESTAADGARSGVNDTDTTIYALKKWASLAVDGNPTVLTALFLNNELDDPFCAWMWKYYVLQVRPAFISKSAGRKFLGYMTSQKLALQGLRNKKTNRPELEHKYGYDSKFAYHAVRLGVQGIELMRTHELRLPMRPMDISALLDIRNGQAFTKEGIISFIESLELQLQSAIEDSTLPENADRSRINQMLHDTYMEVWDQ